jgi:hypothetical protein
MPIPQLAPLTRVNLPPTPLVLVPLERLLRVLPLEVKEVEDAECRDDDREGDEDSGGLVVARGLVSGEEPGGGLYVGAGLVRKRGRERGKERTIPPALVEQKPIATAVALR